MPLACLVLPFLVGGLECASVAVENQPQLIGWLIGKTEAEPSSVRKNVRIRHLQTPSVTWYELEPEVCCAIRVVIAANIVSKRGEDRLVYLRCEEADPLQQAVLIGNAWGVGEDDMSSVDAFGDADWSLHD